jgi:hypothetical protein
MLKQEIPAVDAPANELSSQTKEQQNFREADDQLKALTYWNEKPDRKLSLICTAIASAGVLGSLAFASLIPAAAGIAVAGIYYVLRYQE